MERERKMELLGATSLFRDLPRGELGSLVEGCTVRRYKTGEDVVREGEPADALFVVVEGTARVSSSFAGATKEVGVLEAGDLFGEVGVLDGAQRTATVTAQEPMVCLRLAADALRPVFDAHPEMRERLERLGHRRTTTNLQVHLGELPEVPDGE